MTDPRDFDTRAELDRRLDPHGMSSPTPWGWIAAGVFIVFLLALVFTSGNNTQTARNGANPPATTGMGMNPPAGPPAGPPASSDAPR